MKTKLYSLIAALSMLIFAGCATTSKPGTPPAPGVSPEAVAKAAILLKNTATATLVLVIDKNGDNARAYIVASIAILDQFVLAGSSDPAALEKALYALPIKELKKPEVTLTISAIVTAYELYYADYVSGKVNGNDTAKTLLTALHDGAVNALAASSK